jgi:hypothetical protein
MRRRGGAYSGCEEQVAHWVDVGVVLLQGSLVYLFTEGEICARLALEHEISQLPNESIL